MSDFWEKIAANPSSHLLTGAMDSHLSGKAVGESFEGVRALTDGSRAAKALDLSTAAGTKVSFAGELGAYLTYDDTPPKGATGEVVNVKSANGDITNHDGKVFVQWDDGKFRAIHAEHLRLASQDTSQDKTASEEGQSKIARDEVLMTWTYNAGDGDGGKTTTIVASIKADNRGNLFMEESFSQEDWATGRTSTNTSTKRLGTVRDPDLQAAKRIFSDKKKGWTAKGRSIRSPIQHLKKVVREQQKRMAHEGKTADLKADFEKIKALAEKKPDSKFLKSLLKQMADKGFAPTDKQMAVIKKIEGEVKEMASMQKQLKSLGKKAAPRWIPPDPTFTKVVVWASKLKDGESATAWDVSRELGVPPLGAGHALESLVAKGVLKKDRKYYSKKAGSASQDENDIGDGGVIEAPPSMKETLEGHFGQDPFSELTERVEKDQLGKAASVRVASLGDLSDFLKVAEGVLIHKSTNDLWSFSKDADGAFLVSRLFDDNGSPLQG
tara:strand:- start:1689 stop:3176 length:1488 start_codon:yes stop_codon:yes gene_type:complete